MSNRPAWIRPAVLAAAGAATLAAAFHFVGSDGDGVVQSTARADENAALTAQGSGAAPAVGSPQATPAGAAAPSLPTRSRFAASASNDPFAPKGWLPPPPPPPPAAAALPPPPPPAPTAPPVPFRFVGLIEEKAAKPAAFIAKGEALFVVHVGDVVESTYRIESFNSAQVVITYLPLQQRQTIEVTGG
jgi:hypothetical protein